MSPKVDIQWAAEREFSDVILTNIEQRLACLRLMVVGLHAVIQDHQAICVVHTFLNDALESLEKERATLVSIRELDGNPAAAPDAPLIAAVLH